MSDQRQSSSYNQQNAEQGIAMTCCIPLTYCYLCMMLLALIIFIIYTIVAMTQNQDQEQVIIMCKLLIVTSMLMCSLLIFYLYTLRHFVFTNAQNQNREKTYICSTYEQILHLPIHYFLFIYGTANLLLTFQFQPHYKKFCKDSNYYCDCLADEADTECYSVQIPFRYSGPLLQGLSDFAILIVSIIYALELVIVISYIARADKEIQMNEQHIQQTKSQAKIYLMLFFTYSVLKIISYIVILGEYQNPSSVILVTSNIYFHLIMILVIYRTFYIVRECNTQSYHNFYNCMTLIHRIVQQDKINRVLNILAFFGLAFTSVGFGYFEPQLNTDDLINIEFYIYFDCIGIQIFSNVALFLQFLLYPFCIEPCMDRQYENQKKQILAIQQDQTIPIQQAQIMPAQQAQIMPAQQAQIRPVQQQQTLSAQQAQMQMQAMIQAQLPQLQPLNKGEVRKKAYVQVKNNKQQRTCIICLEFTTNFVRMRCHENHVFHQRCIDAWLRHHNTCPYCNAPAIYC